MTDAIGGMNRRIHILKIVETGEDEYGFTQDKTQDVFGHAIWAKIEPARGRTYYEQYKDKTEFITKITIRYREGLDETMLVQYKDKTYKITSIIDPYAAHERLELMCNLKRVGGPQ